MNIAGILRRAAQLWPAAPAVAVGVRPVWSYAQFARLVGTTAQALRQHYRLEPGARVGLAMTNRPEFLQILFAVWHAGLCVVPMNPRLHRQEFAYILENAGAELCFISPDLAPALTGLTDQVDSLRHLVVTDDPAFAGLDTGGMMPLVATPSDAPAWIFYTSGTTGRPKGATLTHRNLAFMTQAYYADIDQVLPNETMLHAAALSHGSGLYALPLIAQGGLNVVCESPHFDPAEIGRLLAVYPQVSFFAAPTMLTRLVAHVSQSGASTANLKTIVYGGGPMYVADLRRATDIFGPKLAQIYGQGESPMTITALPKAWHADRSHPRFEARLGSCGMPRTLVDVRVVNERGEDLPLGALGEVITRSDCVMAGYWNAPEATANTLRGGWLHTGDLGSFDSDGLLTLKDRSKDMIISGGSNIYPREIEEILLRHPGVEEASVVGRAHSDWVEEVVAFVVPRKGRTVSEAELEQLCLDNIARYKRPRAYFFEKSLPKNNYGKVLKTELRARFSLGSTP